MASLLRVGMGGLGGLAAGGLVAFFCGAPLGGSGEPAAGQSGVPQEAPSSPAVRAATSGDGGPRPSLVGRGMALAGVAAPAAGGDGVPPPWTVEVLVRACPLASTWRREALPTVDPAAALGPVAGAEVRLWLSGPCTSELLGAARAGDDGRARFDLSRLASSSRSRLGRCRLAAYAYAPGHAAPADQPGRVAGVLDEALEPRGLRLDVFLVPGPVAWGRVLDPEGAPVAFARIEHEVPQGDAPRPGLAWCDPEGRYAVPIPPTSTFTLRVTCRNLVGVETGEIPAAGAADVHVPDVRLRGLPRAVGLVRYANGDPVAELEFQMRSAADGCGYGRCDPSRTDRDGRFTFTPGRGPELRGAREPGWSIHVPGLPDLEVAPASPGGELVVTLPTHRLRVRLLDEEDAPLAGETVHLLGAGDRLVAASAATGVGGEVSLFAACGASVRLAAVLAGGHVVARDLTVPSDGNESVVWLRAASRLPSGRLAFRSRTARGDPRFPFELRLLDERGVTILEREIGSAEDLLPLAPGRYRIRATFAVRDAPWDDAPVLVATFAPDVPIDVSPGKTATVDLCWTTSAALALTPRLARGPARLPPGALWLEPLDGGHPPREVTRSLEGGRRVCADETYYLSTLLEPGLYRIRWEVPGYEVVTRVALLEADQVTQLDMTLEPER